MGSRCYWWSYCRFHSRLLSDWICCRIDNTCCRIGNRGSFHLLETEEGTASEHTTEHIPEQEAAKAPVLRLKLPDDVTVCSSPVIIQKDEHTVQIQFHDENTQSDAMAWASLEAGGGPSEYYVLDEEGTLQQEVWAGEKLVKMTIQKTVENSDIHGILVSWEHEGVFYELWEDDARDSMDAVIEMASAIAVRSAAVQGN